jgi:hypothetical protein
MCRACLSLVNEAPPLDLGALSFISHRLSYFHLFPLMFVPTSTAIRYLSGIMTDNGWQFLLPFFCLCLREWPLRTEKAPSTKNSEESE